MSGVHGPRIEIDGQKATLEQIWALDLSGEGHFTAMQIRGRRTLGMDVHLARLDAATRELFDVGLDPDRVRGSIRHALGDDIEDATLRVNVFSSARSGEASIAVSIRPPAATPAQDQRLAVVEYQRPLAHLKRVTGFGQSYFGSFARATGFDEALFVANDGAISEGSITNIGFIDGDTVVWPDAPALPGIMMQVLRRELERAGIGWRSESVNIADVGSFDGAFLTNARGIATVASIGTVRLPTDSGLMKTATELLAVAEFDLI